MICVSMCDSSHSEIAYSTVLTNSCSSSHCCSHFTGDLFSECKLTAIDKFVPNQLTLAHIYLPFHPQGRWSECVNPYISTQTPKEDKKQNHLSSLGWQSKYFLWPDVQSDNYRHWKSIRSCKTLNVLTEIRCHWTTQNSNSASRARVNVLAYLKKHAWH